MGLLSTGTKLSSTRSLHLFSVSISLDGVWTPSSAEFSMELRTGKTMDSQFLNLSVLMHKFLLYKNKGHKCLPPKVRPLWGSNVITRALYLGQCLIHKPSWQNVFVVFIIIVSVMGITEIKTSKSHALFLHLFQFYASKSISQFLEYS